MNYCSQCGSDQLRHEIPMGDHRPRWVCSSCTKIYYENPLMVVGTLPLYEGRILLAKRGIEPRSGLWNLPAGFMEMNETIEHGALRETHEETGLHVKLGYPLALFSISQSNHTYFFFTAEMQNTNWQTNEESTEFALFEPHAIPWQQLAFSANIFAIDAYLKNINTNKTNFYVGKHDASKERLITYI